MPSWITAGLAALALAALPQGALRAQPAAPGAATPAPAPANIGDLQRRAAAFNARLAARFGAFEERLKAAQEQVRDRRKATENADAIIDGMLEHLRTAVDEGRPDSALAQDILVMMRMANELSLQAQNDNDAIFANIFKQQWERFTGLRNQLEASYDRGLRAIRELDARKRTIRRAVQAEQFEIAYATLSTAVSDYKGVVDDAAALAKTAAEASDRPRQ